MYMALACSGRSHESGKMGLSATVHFRRAERDGFKDARNDKIISHKVSSILYVFGIACFHVRLSIEL